MNQTVIFFLILSFLFNALSIFAIILLYLRQNRFARAEQNVNKMVKEIEDIFSVYLMELKEENDAFIKKMKAGRMKEAGPAEKAGPETEQPAPETKKPPETGETAGPKPDALIRTSANRAYRNAARQILGEQSEGQLQEEKSLLQKVNDLQQNGYTVDEIAQKLNKGRTEIELLLKFQTGRG
ncbi:hypothetical protein P9G49_01015 [Heyndrickxia coagulans]|uniref:hypothetical protein n=1 Tax=Heyndrickxia coagulans TaxID=1398 RepID=UPI002E09A008|nr:hypothetical protein [Heyndrickxia coagulans]